MKLEITKERILEAASKCSTAKETLKTLFPEVFDEDKYVDLSPAVLEGGNFDTTKLPRDRRRPFIQIRVGGEYEMKSFYLSREFNWQLKKDTYGEFVLIPTKK